MKTILATAFLAFLVSTHTGRAAAETAFLHEGVIEAHIPSAITLDLRFRLFDDASGGVPLGDTALTEDVRVQKRAYTVLLDFGVEVFDGEPRWLEVAFRPAASTGEFLVLPERTQILPVPAALHALTANRLLGPLPAAQLPPEAARLDVAQTFTGAVTFAPAAGAPFAVGSSNVVPNLNADQLDGYDASSFWQLAGNAGTTPGTSFLGTTDNAPLELRVNGERVGLFLPNTNSPNIVLGSQFNAISNGAIGSVVLGGGAIEKLRTRTNDLRNVVESNFSVVVGGAGNTNSSELGVIGGGAFNRIQPGADFAIISGGLQNLIGSNVSGSFIGGGNQNRILPSTFNSAIVSGYDNTISNSSGAFIGGGFQNKLSARSYYAVIGGGVRNSIGERGQQSVIGGGSVNVVASNASGSVIGGGLRNLINTNASFAVIPGGTYAHAENYGQLAFASGVFGLDRRAGSAQTSTFVLRRISTNDVPVILALNGTTNVIRLRPGSRWAFDALVTAGTTNGLTAGFHLRGVIKNLGGVTTLVGAPALAPLGADAGAEGWTVTAEADDVRDALILRATGSPGQLIRWVATVRTAELIY